MKRTLAYAARILFAVTVVMAASAAPYGRAHAIEPGAKPKDLKLIALDGRDVSLSKLGGKVVVVDFWASWCAPCKEEMPVLERLHKRLRDKGLVVIGVSVDSDREKAEQFAAKLKISFPIVHDAKHAVADAYAPPKMPTSIIFDRSGTARFVHAGYHAEDAAKIEREVLELLK